MTSSTTTNATLILVAAMAVSACGEETTTSTGSGGSGGATQTGTGGASAGGGTAQGGSGQGGSGQTGCVADPDLCTGGLVCCSGVPYPTEGTCQTDCSMDSDRRIKHDVQAVDGDRVLERLASLEVSRWRYDASPEHVHMGPMAQDFHAAFGLGNDDRHIAPVDANGVTMAAIQALYRRVEQLESASAERQQQNQALRSEVAALKRQLERRRQPSRLTWSP